MSPLASPKLHLVALSNLFLSESGIWIVRSAIPEGFMFEHFRSFYGSAREFIC